MSQAPGTQDVEKRMMELKAEVVGLQAQLPVLNVHDRPHAAEVVQECRQKYAEMSKLADEQRRETLDWIQEKLDATEVYSQPPTRGEHNEREEQHEATSDKAIRRSAFDSV